MRRRWHRPLLRVHVRLVACPPCHTCCQESSSLRPRWRADTHTDNTDTHTDIQTHGQSDRHMHTLSNRINTLTLAFTGIAEQFIRVWLNSLKAVSNNTGTRQKWPSFYVRCLVCYGSYLWQSMILITHTTGRWPGVSDFP